MIRRLAAMSVCALAVLLPGCRTANETPEHEIAPAPSAPVHAEIAAPPVEGPSLYDLSLALTDHDGQKLGLDVFRGRPVIVSMFYAGCPYACPTLISDIQRIEQKLEPEARSRLRVLLVTFDHERDTPARLKALARERKLDRSRWKLARASEEHVRDLAAVLGLKYRELEGGAFNHSSVITLLDGEGRIRARVEGLAQPADSLAGSAAALLGGLERPVL